MRRSLIARQRAFVLTFLLAICGGSVSSSFGDSPANLRLKGKGAIDLSANGISSFVLKGSAQHLGKYQCYGEAEFLPGEDEGSLDGVGVVVLEAADGDLLVGVAIWQLSADGEGQATFWWRDSVEFNDGTTVSNTGRFVRSRPQGVLISIRWILGDLGIIAILIGL